MDGCVCLDCVTLSCSLYNPEVHRSSITGLLLQLTYWTSYGMWHQSRPNYVMNKNNAMQNLEPQCTAEGIVTDMAIAIRFSICF